MRGDVPGIYHRNFGYFQGAAGGQKKIAPLGVAGGKNKINSGSLNRVDRSEKRDKHVPPQQEGTNMCRLNTCRLIPLLEDSALCLHSFLASPYTSHKHQWLIVVISRKRYSKPIIKRFPMCPMFGHTNAQPTQTVSNSNSYSLAYSTSHQTLSKHEHRMTKQIYRPSRKLRYRYSPPFPK